MLGTNLLRAFSHSGTLIELHSYAPALVAEVTEKPLASRSARYQAPSVDRVTNLSHERVSLDPLGAFLLPYLDGRHDHEAPLELLMQGPVAGGTLRLEHEGEPVRDPQQLRAVLSDEMERLLRWFAFAALLVG